MTNLKLAFRALFRSPVVTGVTILSLALGLGANAAIFSLFRELVLSPLPVPAPERLVNVSAPGPKPGTVNSNQAGPTDQVLSYAMYRDLERAAAPRIELAAHFLIGASVAVREQTISGEGMLVSGSYFPVLGVRPAAGRLLSPADDAAVGAHPVAVLDHGFWSTALASDAGVVGQPIIINGHTFTVVGVAPAGFRGTTLGGLPLVYVPISMRGVVQPGFAGFENRRSYWLYTFGRLAPGVTSEQAEAALNGVYQPLIADEVPLQAGMTEETLARFAARRLELLDGRRGQSILHGAVGTPLLLMLVTAGLVLLIACANVANLLLARGAGRGLEMAVRLSLGAHRRQVLAQLLTESLVLAALGGAAGLLVARWMLDGVLLLLPPEGAALVTPQLNPSILLFTAAISLGTGLLFGLFPALHSTRPGLVDTIRANAGSLTATRGAARFRSTLVTAQIALSVTLMIVAGLFVRSLSNLDRVELGLDTAPVITFSVSPERSGYEPARSEQLFERLEAELDALPGVTRASGARVPILANSNWDENVFVQGADMRADADRVAMFNAVGPGWFETLGIPLLRGRDFTDADRAGAARVVIVNEAFLRKFSLGADALGTRMAIGAGMELDLEIVGVVADASYSEVRRAPPPQFYTPWRQNARVGDLTFYVNSSGDAGATLRAVRAVVTAADPNLPVDQLKTLPRQVQEHLAIDRIIGSLSAAFAGLATLLAMVGLYGVLAYSVTTRTREIGIRVALGARPSAVRLLVMRQVAVMLLVGALLGVAAAAGIGRAAEALLFGVDGSDPLVFLAAVTLLSALALAAGYVPADRAARVEPLRIMREQ